MTPPQPSPKGREPVFVEIKASISVGSAPSLGGGWGRSASRSFHPLSFCLTSHIFRLSSFVLCLMSYISHLTSNKQPSTLSCSFRWFPAIPFRDPTLG